MDNDEPRVAARSIVGVDDATARRLQYLRIMLSRKFNDTSPYHCHASFIRPSMIALRISRLVFLMHLRPDGGPMMLTINTQQQLQKLLLDDMLRVRSVCCLTLRLPLLRCLPLRCD